jgi:hypothetical protein
MQRERRPSRRLCEAQESADIELTQLKPRARSGGARGAALAPGRDACADERRLAPEPGQGEPVLESKTDRMAQNRREKAEAAAARKEAAAAKKEEKARAQALREAARKVKGQQATEAGAEGPAREGEAAPGGAEPGGGGGMASPAKRRGRDRVGGSAAGVDAAAHQGAHRRESSI